MVNLLHFSIKFVKRSKYSESKFKATLFETKHMLNLKKRSLSELKSPMDEMIKEALKFLKYNLIKGYKRIKQCLNVFAANNILLMRNWNDALINDRSLTRAVIE